MHQINREICSSSPGSPPTKAVSLPEFVPTDGELLLRFTRGEQAAFAKLIDRHQRVVWLACWQVLRHRHDVEDTFQATFLILARKASSLHTVDSLAAWLHRVAYRAAIRLLRHRKRNTAAQLPTEVEMAEDKLLQIQRREESSILLEEMRALPDKYQVPLILCYLEGRTRSAAADEMGCTTATIKGRLARGKSMLRVRLARRGVGFSVAMAALATPLRQAEASLTGSWIASIVDGCQAVQLGQPLPESLSSNGLSTQAVSLSQQTLLQQGLLTMTTASFAKPICLGVALLGLATVAVAEATKEEAGSAVAVEFNLPAAEAESAEVVAVEIAANPAATASSVLAESNPQKKPLPAIAELPELPELGVDLPDHATGTRRPIATPAASSFNLPVRVGGPLAAQTIARTVAVPKKLKANPETISALQDAKKSLQLKSEGLQLQAEAKTARVEALQADNEEVRKELLKRAEVLELKAEAVLLKAEALMTGAKVLEIDRQIEHASKPPQAAIPVAPQPVMNVTAPQPPKRLYSYNKTKQPGSASASTGEDVVEIHLTENVMQLQKHEAELHALKEVVDLQRKKHARAVEQMRKVHADQVRALKDAEVKLKEQLLDLAMQRRELTRQQEQLEKSPARTPRR